ncbi:MAG: type II secretion system protein [Pyrinomonadaceae bacterium]|nr:type II secretion system protein [Pyrinomonadaceae bacterium]
MKRRRAEKGFTIPEVIVAGMIMIILCVGILTAYTHVVNLNRGNNIRSQALTVLQREVEAFRSFRFVPGTTDVRLNAGDYPNYKTGVPSADGIPFNISVNITNDPNNTFDPDPTEANCRFKQITITAVLQNPEAGYLSDLRTTVTIQRVRSN